MTTDIILIRHGQTSWNKKGIFQGWNDIELDEEGIRQALKTAEELKAHKFHAIYSSPLKRAQQTAEKIAKHHNLPIFEVAEFKERSYGIFEGKSWEDFDKDEKARQKYNKRGRFLYKPPKGESYLNLYRRVSAKLDEIVSKHKKEKIAIISHGGVMWSIFYHVGIVKKEQGGLDMPNASYFHIQFHHIEKRYIPIKVPSFEE